MMLGTGMEKPHNESLSWMRMKMMTTTAGEPRMKMKLSNRTHKMMLGAGAEKLHNGGLSWMWMKMMTTIAGESRMKMKSSPIGRRAAPKEPK
jgi:hypothetical protein